MGHHIEGHQRDEEPAYVGSGILLPHELGEAQGRLDQNKGSYFVENFETLGQVVIKWLEDNEIAELYHGHLKKSNDEECLIFNEPEGENDKNVSTNDEEYWEKDRTSSVSSKSFISRPISLIKVFVSKLFKLSAIENQSPYWQDSENCHLTVGEHIIDEEVRSISFATLLEEVPSVRYVHIGTDADLKDTLEEHSDPIIPKQALRAVSVISTDSIFTGSTIGSEE